MGADPARTVLRAPRLCYCPVPEGSREARLTLAFLDKEVPALAALRCSLASSSELTGPAVKGVRGCRPLAAVPGVFWVQGAFPSSTLFGDLQAACRVTWRLFFSTPTFPKQLPRLRPQGPRGEAHTTPTPCPAPLLRSLSDGRSLQVVPHKLPLLQTQVPSTPHVLLLSSLGCSPSFLEPPPRPGPASSTPRASSKPELHGSQTVLCKNANRTLHSCA